MLKGTLGLSLLLALGATACETKQAVPPPRGDITIDVIAFERSDRLGIGFSNPVYPQLPAGSTCWSSVDESGDLSGLRMWVEPTADSLPQQTIVRALAPRHLPGVDEEVVVTIESKLTFQVQLRGWEDYKIQMAWRVPERRWVDNEVMPPGDYKLAITRRK